ncbi:phosphate ABC transporter substrate-binding protein PstS [Thiotrichales bacterium 19S3-7]|nr:phosphate ABC transporter substrate-binding protein PstS [Thiotrichales bacterium 19S3-7]MCF6801663.1 phosphate ABC transporter substrate-binding protein PstS [Thiotrichales bacterium 19S3-11]
MAKNTQSIKRLKAFLFSLFAVITLVSLTACSDSNQSSDGQTSTQAETKIMGAGSSFIYPVMSRWSNNYYQRTNVQINYQPIGSGGGQRQIFQRTVDFAASDQPLDAQTLKKYKLIQFPMIVGGIVAVVNLKGVSSNQLILSGPVLADIYMGKIRYWDDSQIKNLNPKLTLTHSLIIPVRRADGSGTTYNFADYLAKVSPLWQKNVGVNTTLTWPSTTIGAKGNAGVAAQVMQLPNSIGYVEYAYAKENHMNTVKLINKNGKAIAPTLSSFRSSAEYADWSSKNDYHVLLTDQAGNNSWPIDASTFILLPIDNSSETNQTILAFLSWAYGESGRDIAAKLDYIGIPESTVKGIKSYWQERLASAK